MKNTSITVYTLLAIGMALTINPVLAGDRVKVYEMAESGITIEFAMTPVGNAAEDTGHAEQAVVRVASNADPQKRVKVIEMGESGQSASFPMTAEEIAAKDAENERLAAVRKAKSDEHKKQVVTYELAESGIPVEFAVETPDKAVVEARTLEAAEDLKI